MMKVPISENLICMSEKENKMVRFPRPMGTTAMALEYQKNPNDELLIKIHNYIINQWLMGDGDAFGRLDADCLDDVRELLRLEAELDEELPGHSCGVLSFSSSISNPESLSKESGSHHGKMGSPALNGSMSVWRLLMRASCAAGAVLRGDVAADAHSIAAGWPSSC